jgi:O-antigen ligase
MFLSFYSVINRLKFSGLYLLDIGIMLLFAFQGLLSFSRGGMIIAGVGMAIIFFFNNRDQIKGKRIYLFVGGITALLAVFILFQVTDEITGGNLSLRYSGETEGTIAGSKDKTADVLVSGRLTILEEDFKLWQDHPILGVGAASSSYLRERMQYIAPHIELSRLLAEHGILGLLHFIILLSIYWNAYKGLSKKVNKGLFVALFAVAMLTTFHAAMRTYISPTFLILASMLVLPDSQINYGNAHIINRRPKSASAT